MIAIAPGAAIDGSPRLTLAEKLAENNSDGESLRSLGGLLYREGHYDDALAQLAESATMNGQGGSIGTKLFAAMTYHQLRQTDRAKTVFATAVREIQESNSKAKWQERLCWDILRREAESLINPQAEQ